MMRTLLLLSFLSLAACGDDDGTVDAGRDSGRDATTDVGADTRPTDTGADTNDIDAGTDGGADAGEDVGADAGIDGGPRDCASATAVANADPLSDMTPAIFGSAARSADRPSAGDFVATAAFVVSGSDFPVPSDCADRCTSGPFLQVVGDVPGVTSAGTTVSIAAGATFRLRFDIPTGGLLRPEPVVYFERPTCLECSSGGRRCDVDDACYDAGERYCLECDGDSPMRCACVDESGMNVPDDTECFFVTGDIAEVGVCESGSCMRSF